MSKEPLNRGRGIHAIAMLEHALHVAKSKATRGDVSRSVDMQTIALNKARSSTALTMQQRGANVGRSNRGCFPCSIAVKANGAFDKATSSRTKFWSLHDSKGNESRILCGGEPQVRVFGELHGRNKA